MAAKNDFDELKTLVLNNFVVEGRWAIEFCFIPSLTPETNEDGLVYKLDPYQDGKRKLLLEKIRKAIMVTTGESWLFTVFEQYEY